jgi:hypothetical protein
MRCLNYWVLHISCKEAFIKLGDFKHYCFGAILPSLPLTIPNRNR